MCVEAFMIANRSGYPALPCAAFDAKNPAVANVLWLFYISKVRTIVADRPLPFVVHTPWKRGYEACPYLGGRLNMREVHAMGLPCAAVLVHTRDVAML